MTDTPMGLTPANQNPWYVLMTLYGEQEGETVDEELHARNRAAWNAWACQGMTEEERAKAATSSGVTVEELSAWPELSAQIAQLHSDIWLERNHGLEWPGLPVLGIVNLNNVFFDHFLNMDRTIFGGPALFKRSRFSRDVSFKSATFKSGAAFDNATFGGHASFDYATFLNSAFFDSATFVGAADFLFADSFNDARFPQARFDSFARFRSAKFRGGAYFYGATFKDIADFGSAEFGTSVEIHHSDFRVCQFEKPTSFRNATFLDNYVNFSGAILHEKTLFTDHPDNWPKGPQSDPAQAKATCAVIRHNLGKQGLPEAEHFFFRREMGFAGRSGPLLQRPPYWLFGWFSDYGASILTPLLWLCLLIVAGGSVLAWGLTGATPHVGFEEGLGLSFANVFNFLSFHKTFATETTMAGLSPAMKMFSGFQSIAGVILLFFLGLGLRTRFRLR